MVLDLKDAFHLLRLSEDSKKYCSILPYFGSASYMYQRMPMGLNISPSIWQSYINTTLECLPNRKHCEAIMDDLLLFTLLKKAHMTIYERKKVYIKPLRSRIEAIQKLTPPTTPKGCRSFTGMVNFLSMFCPYLQRLLKPIYDLTRKGRHFIWGKEQ